MKVTFNESPDIRRVGEIGSRPTAESTNKSDRVSIIKTTYSNEEAKVAYNGLMIRNYKIQQEVNAYARHSRIQAQKKALLRKEQEDDDNMSPVVIFDGDTPKDSLRKSTIKSSMKKPSKLPESPQPVKPYGFKFRVIKVRYSEPLDETTYLDISKSQCINLKVTPFYNY